jgi:hypothetical protein
MKVFNLQCGSGHGFEGWFASDDEYTRQVGQGLLECPLCGNHTVRRLPSAPRLNLASHRDGAGGAIRPAPRQSDPGQRSPAAHSGGHTPAVEQITPEQQSVESLWLEAVRHVMAHTQDVGSHFAEEARRMHYGESELRGIRGRTTPQEAHDLDDEGIEVFSLPVPDSLKGPAH